MLKDMLCSVQRKLTQLMLIPITLIYNQIIVWWRVSGRWGTTEMDLPTCSSLCYLVNVWKCCMEVHKVMDAAGSSAEWLPWVLQPRQQAFIYVLYSRLWQWLPCHLARGYYVVGVLAPVSFCPACYETCLLLWLPASVAGSHNKRAFLGNLCLPLSHQPAVANVFMCVHACGTPKVDFQYSFYGALLDYYLHHNFSRR